MRTAVTKRGQTVIPAAIRKRYGIHEGDHLVLQLNSEGKTVVTIDPVRSLATKTKYTVKIKGGPRGVKDLAGNALAANKVWTFTTGLK